MSHGLRVTLGVIFVILGIVGSLLPILQGWIFFLIAAILLFPEHPRVERFIEKLEKKLPRLIGWLRKIGVVVDRVPDESETEAQPRPASGE